MNWKKIVEESETELISELICHAKANFTPNCFFVAEKIFFRKIAFFDQIKCFCSFSCEWNLKKKAMYSQAAHWKVMYNFSFNGSTK